MKSKKGIIILSTVVIACAVGFIVSPLVNWSVDESNASGNIAKSSRFSRKTAAESLTNMEELLANDESFKDGVVASYVVMKLRADAFDSLVEASNEAAGDLPEFASVLKDMNASREMVKNVCASLTQAGEDLNAALSGEARPDLAQNTMNASLAYTTLQKQNKLADRFIATTDEYLKKSEADDVLKLVRDQWVDYQRQTAALDGDEKSAKELEEKGYLLSAEQSAKALKCLNQEFVVCSFGEHVVNEILQIDGGGVNEIFHLNNEFQLEAGVFRMLENEVSVDGLSSEIKVDGLSSEIKVDGLSSEIKLDGLGSEIKLNGLGEQFTTNGLGDIIQTLSVGEVPHIEGF